MQYKKDLVQYWKDDNSIFTSELSPTILLSSVAEDSENEDYQTSGESCPFNSISHKTCECDQFSCCSPKTSEFDLQGCINTGNPW